MKKIPVLFMMLLCGAVIIPCGSVAAPQAYGLHVVTYSDSTSNLALAVPGDNYFAFQNWEITIYGRDNSSYQVVKMKSGDTIESGTFSGVVVVEFRLDVGLHNIEVILDGLTFQFKNTLVKGGSFYHLSSQADEPSEWDEEVITTVYALMLRDMKVSLMSLVLATGTFYYVMKKNEGKEDKRAGQVL